MSFTALSVTTEPVVEETAAYKYRAGIRTTVWFFFIPIYSRTIWESSK